MSSYLTFDPMRKPGRRSESPSRVYWRKGFTFGCSQRSPVDIVHGRVTPSPAAYNIDKSTRDYWKGPILRGLANVESSKVRVSNLPGPGSYSPYEPLGKNAPKYTIKHKLEMRFRSKSPGPSEYYPNFRATQNNCYREIQFGYCDKERSSQFSKKRNNPGPGSYEIPSIFSNTLANFSPARG